jgi:hypothetical protein
MRKLDSVLLNARNKDLESKIANAKFIESLEVNGTSPEELLSQGRDILNIGEEDSIMTSFQDIMADYNKQLSSLFKLNGAIPELKDSGVLTDEELSTLVAIEDKLANIIAKRYDIDLEELFMEE